MIDSYERERSVRPQSVVVVAVAEDLPTTVDLWDNADGVFSGSAGICDLIWWPGWMLDDYRFREFSSWKTGPWVSLSIWPGPPTGLSPR